VKAQFGVEPVCRVLSEHGMQIAPSTYYAHKTRPASARELRDEELKTEILRVWADKDLGRGLAGARKVWHLLLREGVQVARCTVERLMHDLGLHGVTRAPLRVRTTVPGRRDSGPRPPDLCERNFTAAGPNRLWLVDFTYVPTWSGTRFTAFVSDAYSRRIVGWRTAASMPTQLPLDALEMALWARAGAGQDVTGVIHHSDAGSQGGFNWSSQHLDRGGGYGTTRGLGVEQDRPGGDAVAGAAWAASRCRAGVLVKCRCGTVQRGRRGGLRCVGAGRCPLVSSRWRNAAYGSCAALGAVLVVRRTRGTRAAQRPGSRSAGNRTPGRPGAVDDLA
jgi:putative transposase